MTVEIDQTISHIETLYQSLTGNEPPKGTSPFAPIPPEVDAQAYVEERLAQLAELMKGTTAGTMAPTVAWPPPIAICETATEILVSFDLAGVPREGVEVCLVDGLLMVSGHRPAPWTNGHKGAVPRVAEPPFGAFRRTVALPAGIASDKLTAQMKDGVLEIGIPRDQKAAPRKQSVAVK
jgi:HSP20 family protein